MAGDFDGSDFVGLDTDIVGAGTSDSNTQSLSTYIENRIDGNRRYLEERGSRVTRTFRVKHGGDNGGRQLIGSKGSIGRTTIHHQIVPIQSNLTTLTAHIIGQIDVTGASNSEILFTLEVVDLSTGTNYTTTNTVTGSGLGTRDLIELSLDLSDAELSGELADVNIWLNSLQDNEETASFEDIDLANQWQINIGGNPLEFDVGRSQILKLNSGGSGQIPAFHNSQDDGSGNAYVGSNSSQGYNNPNAKAVNVSYLVPFSVSFEYEYDDTEPTPIYTPKQAASMRAQNAVQGSDVSRHASNSDGYAKRERQLAIGPDGDEIVDSNQPNDYRFLWRWTAEKQVPSVTSHHGNTLDRQMTRLPTESGKVLLHAYLAGFWVGADVSPYVLDNWSQQTLSADLDVSASITEWGSGGSDVFASTTSTIREAQYHRLNPTSAVYLPNVAYWTFFPFGGATNTDLSDLNHTFFEGQLWREDFALLTPVTIELEYSTATMGRPVELELTYDDIDIDTDGALEFSIATICTQTTWTHRAL